MKPFAIVLFVCMFALFSESLANAQGYNPQDSNLDMSENVSAQADKKSRGWLFNHPDKESVEEQFTLAREQERGGKLRSAKNSYNALIHEWHDTEEAVKAQSRLAHILFEQGKYKKSFKEFQYLIDHYVGQFGYKEVIDYQIKIANYVMGDRWGDVLFMPGFKAPERALPLFEQIIVNAPNLKVTPAVRLKIAGLYEEMNNYENAIVVYDAVQQYHGLSVEAETALFRKSYCLYVLAEKAPRDEKRCRLALSAYASFLSRYKMSPHKMDAEGYMEDLNVQLSDMYYSRALFYDGANPRPKSALIAYRDFLKKFPGAANSQAVYARIVELEKQVKE
jgi:outer membrane protein assembly factor BamD (BamD/ComL family)